MSKIPEVMESSADNIRLNFERLGNQYVFDIIDDVLDKQPMISEEIHDTLNFIRDTLVKEKVKAEVVNHILENLGYRMFAIIKSLYIQEEVDDLEEQANMPVGRKHEEN